MCLAIPAKVVETFCGEQSSALVEVAGIRRHTNTGLLQDNPPHIGDWVLVHVGFAMSKISEEQALDQLQTLSKQSRDPYRLGVHLLVQCGQSGSCGLSESRRAH